MGNGNHEHDDEEALQPQNILDLVTFGRRLRAVRILHGYDRMSDFASVLRARYGVELSDRTVYAIERGEQMPHLDFFFAVLALLQPSPGYFDPAIRHDVAEAIQRVVRG